MHPNKLPNISHETPPPPPTVTSQTPSPWQQSTMVLAPPRHYNPPMFPPQFYHLTPSTLAPPNHQYPDHERDWSTGLFQCTSNMKNCINHIFIDIISSLWNVDYMKSFYPKFQVSSQPYVLALRLGRSLRS